MEIGSAIRRLRREQQLTQEKLADLACTSKPNISNLERDAQGYSPALLKNLAKALGIRVSDIFVLAEQISDCCDNDSPSFSQLPQKPYVVDDTAHLLSLWDKLSLSQKKALLHMLQQLIG